MKVAKLDKGSYTTADGLVVMEETISFRLSEVQKFCSKIRKSYYPEAEIVKTPEGRYGVAF